MRLVRENKWSDFLFAIAVRLVCGIVLGGVACLLFSWRGILRSFSHDNTRVPLIWLGVCGLGGGIIAVFTVPRWQTPWYKRDSEAQGLWVEAVSIGPDLTKPGPGMVGKSISITTVDESGAQHEYHSPEEAPPEIRAQIEALEKEAAQGSGNEVSVTEISQMGDAITSKIVSRKSISVYKIVDESGVERVYHSLEEMPPEIRAAIARAEEKARE